MRHWSPSFKKYFVITKGIKVFCRDYDSDFFDLFKNEIINFEYMKNVYNCFIENDDQYNFYVYFFKTKKDALRCLNELLMPYIVMEKLMN